MNETTKKMKKLISILGIAFILLSSCSSNKKMHFYNKFKSEISTNTFNQFEKFLPSSYKNSLMAEINYVPSYKAFGYSGIEVVYQLNKKDFKKNLNKLRSADIASNKLIYDTLAFNRSNSNYYSLNSHQRKIAIPNVNEDFRQEQDTCNVTNGSEMMILGTGIKNVFSTNVRQKYQLKNSECKYSIGALISKQRHQIIYWLLIYN